MPKKPKVVKPFYFKGLTHQQVSDILNQELPISLKYNSDLVDKVYNKYPLIEKSYVAIIIKTIFQSLRELLILAKVLNFNTLFFDTKLLIFGHRYNGVIFPKIKVRISTPPPLREL